MKKLGKNLLDKMRTNAVVKMVCMILIACLGVAIAQGCTPLFEASHQIKVMVLLGIFLLYFAFLYYMKVSNRLTEENGVFMLILFGVLLRCSYVVLSGLYDRQHDAGAYTGMGTDFVNPGHIGYIEYIYKFHKLPDINPYQLFAYYHPPLHHILSYLWLALNIALGVTEALAFENLQILTLLYSCLCMVVTYKILKLLDAKGKALYIALAFTVLHPSMIIMAGSVNNDMLTTLFMCLTLLGSLQWIRNKNLTNLIKLALYIGLGMITKLNSAVLAIPLALVFLLYLISVLRTKEKTKIGICIQNFAIFAVIVIPIGLSWIIRNLIRFGEKPGVPVPGETSPMYTNAYSLWDRLGIPAFSQWHFDFPFHPISAKAIHNTWVIMFQTSIFAEEYPTDLPDILLCMCQIVYVLAIIFGIATAILLVVVLCKKITGKEDSIFLLTGYLLTLISFAAFVIVYPYTCSSDFRYVTICIVYTSIALALGNRIYTGAAPDSRLRSRIGAICMHVINGGILTILAMLTIIYTFWERW